MKRAVLGGLALILAGVICVPVFMPLGTLNGQGIASAILMLVGGGILATPVILLRVVGRWRVGELLVSIGLFEMACGMVLLVWVLREVAPHPTFHGPGPVLVFLICMFVIGGGMAIPTVIALVLSQLLILWIDNTRSWRTAPRVMPAAAFMILALLAILKVLMAITCA